MEITVSHSELASQGGGWVSFRSFIPDWFLRLNNRFYTVKNGQLWIHNEENNGIRNNFYGVQYDSSVTPIFNDANSDDKIFKTIVEESDDAWRAELLTNYTDSIITKDEFNNRESRWFSYIRKNEDSTDLRGHTSQGIGNIVSSASTVITFGVVPDFANIGDQLYQLNGSNQQLIGTIVSCTQTTINVNAITTIPINGLFTFAKKNPRIEGSEIRGHYLEAKLIHAGGAPSEIFAVNTNAVKSYV